MLEIQFNTKKEMDAAFSNINQHARIIRWSNMLKSITIDIDESDADAIADYI